MININEMKQVLNLSIDEAAYLNDIDHRKIVLNAEIDSLSVNEVIHIILDYNEQDKHCTSERRIPVKLYLNSNGGSVVDGMSLIDVINASSTPIYTINTGYQYSMGFLIGINGHKRFAMPNASFLMHDGNDLIYNSSSKVRDQVDFNNRLEERIKNMVLSRSKMTDEEYEANRRIELYMFADEAKEKGFVDYIIGQDCSLNDIL